MSATGASGSRRTIWWDLNALTPERISSYGLNVLNAGDQAVLRARLDSAAARARGFDKLPYASFPASLTVAQSRGLHPHFGNIPLRLAPLGKTWYDSLQMRVTRRYSHGLTLTGAFTWSKTLTMGAEDFDGGGVFNDVSNRRNQKALSSGDLPYSFVTSFSYRLPRLGQNRVVRSALGDWTISGVLQYTSGALIQVPGAQSNLSQYLFRNTLSNRVSGQPLFLVDPNGPIDPNKEFVLNRPRGCIRRREWGLLGPLLQRLPARRPPRVMELGRHCLWRSGKG